MVDLRLYRAAFLPALIALVALLFSLQSLPGPLRPLISPATFDQAAAARFTKQILARAPERTPGSTGDATAAAMVTKAFAAVPRGEVLRQSFSGTFGGNDVSMQNVVLRLPGSSDRVVALVAPRDTGSGPGATTSAAATGALEELAIELGSARHSTTLLLASTDGSSAGAAGAKQLASALLDSGTVDGVVILAAPGAANPRGPYLIDTADGPERGGVALERTAERALTDQAGVHVSRPGVLTQLARLAIPSGVGEQAPLITRGINAVTLSASGELPPAPSADGPDSLSPRTLGQFGRAALDVVLSLDASPGSLAQSPRSYVEVGGNLVPGWAISVLGLALILPALVAGVDALARAARQGLARTALIWAVPRALPPLGALALLYLLALIGIVTRPASPFDPQTITAGAPEIVALLFLAAVAAVVWRLLRANRVPAGVDPEAAAAALGVLAVLALVGIWAANPYLALLALPLAHLWIPQAQRRRSAPRVRVAILVGVALLPIVLAIESVASRLGLGASMPWQAVVAIGDGGIPVVIAVTVAALGGWLASLVVVAGAAPAAAPGWTDSDRVPSSAGRDGSGGA